MSAPWGTPTVECQTCGEPYHEDEGDDCICRECIRDAGPPYRDTPQIRFVGGVTVNRL